MRMWMWSAMRMRMWSSTVRMWPMRVENGPPMRMQPPTVKSTTWPCVNVGTSRDNRVATNSRNSPSGWTTSPKVVVVITWGISQDVNPSRRAEHVHDKPNHHNEDKDVENNTDPHFYIKFRFGQGWCWVVIIDPIYFGEIRRYRNYLKLTKWLKSND